VTLLHQSAHLQSSTAHCYFKGVQHRAVLSTTYLLSLCSCAARNESFAGHTILDAMVTQAPFEEQQPAIPAMLPAIMKQLVGNAKQDGLSLRLLQLLPRIPLMHTDDYEDVLRMAEIGGSLAMHR
jgi:hypothetical protein